MLRQSGTFEVGYNVADATHQISQPSLSASDVDSAQPQRLGRRLCSCQLAFQQVLAHCHVAASVLPYSEVSLRVAGELTRQRSFRQLDR